MSADDPLFLCQRCKHAVGQHVGLNTCCVAYTSTVGFGRLCNCPRFQHPPEPTTDGPLGFALQPDAGDHR